MLWTIFVVILIAWSIGVVSSYTMGGLLHLLLVVAFGVLFWHFFSGHRATS